MLTFCLLVLTSGHLIGSTKNYDVVVYGGTPGGITAAISASREGASVILLEQTNHVGGLSTSGLNRDEGNHMLRDTLGGLSDKFTIEAMRRSGDLFLSNNARVWQSHKAEEVFLEMLEEAKVPVRYKQLLDGVKMDGAKISKISIHGGEAYEAQVFIDATYEGDLMARAGVSYTVGRESGDTYGEPLAGVSYLDEKIPVSPYDDSGNLLPGIIPGKPPEEFSESAIPICYNIRLNLSLDKDNQVPIEKPENYDPVQFELLARSIEVGAIKTVKDVLALYSMPGGKAECNNRQFSIVSMSMPGEQTAWSEASYSEREEIYRKYRDYTHGMIWFLKTDERVPPAMRKEMALYGLCKDEWQDNGHWPWYLYVRASRRMKGEYILTQLDVTDHREKEDVIHIGSHFIDSHHVSRYAVDENHFINEGRIWQEGLRFDIPYRSLTPKQEECENLLVPVCVSASNVAFCAVRLEPTWMHLGEVSGIAAAMSIKNQSSVQDIDVADLQKRIAAVGIPLESPE